MAHYSVETSGVEDGVVIFDVSGRLDAEAIPTLDRLLCEKLSAGQNRFVVDCEGLQTIDNSVLGVFLSHLVGVRKTDGDIVFCTVGSRARETVSLLGLNNLLKIFRGRREALKHYRVKRSAARPLPPKDDEKLEISTRRFGEIVVLRLKGFVDRHTIAILDEKLTRVMERSPARAVVDCARLSYISSNGVGIFLAYVQKARATKGDICFSAVRGMPLTTILMLGLDKMFRIFPTEEQAVAFFNS